MNQNINFEIRRKLLHITLTFYPFVFIYFNTPESVALIFSLCYFAVLMGSEYLRVHTNIKTITTYMVKSFSRSIKRGIAKEEWNRLRIPYWIIGSTTALLLFNYPGWLAATILLCIGDSLSGIIKATMNKKRTILASSTGLTACFLLLYAITGNLLLSILPSILGMLGDFLSYKGSDNLTIPILAGVGAFIAKTI